MGSFNQLTRNNTTNPANPSNQSQQSTAANNTVFQYQPQIQTQQQYVPYQTAAATFVQSPTGTTTTTGSHSWIDTEQQEGDLLHRLQMRSGSPQMQHIRIHNGGLLGGSPQHQPQHHQQQHQQQQQYYTDLTDFENRAIGEGNGEGGDITWANNRQ